MKKEQNLTDVKMTQHLMRQPPPPRARKWIIYDEKLKRIVDDFESNDLVDYLNAIGNVIRNGIQCESEFSVQIFLTKIGI